MISACVRACVHSAKHIPYTSLTHPRRLFSNPNANNWNVRPRPRRFNRPRPFTRRYMYSKSSTALVWPLTCLAMTQPSLPAPRYHTVSSLSAQRIPGQVSVLSYRHRFKSNMYSTRTPLLARRHDHYTCHAIAADASLRPDLTLGLEAYARRLSVGRPSARPTPRSTFLSLPCHDLGYSALDLPTSSPSSLANLPSASKVFACSLACLFAYLRTCLLVV